MPVSVVVGGQFGSEGKGKTALEIARRDNTPVVAIRVGGPNSGHTGYDRNGTRHVLRQLPAACVDRGIEVVLPAGAYIDVDVFLGEVEQLSYPVENIAISHHARVIRPEHRTWERDANLMAMIGSTGAGVGGAVMASVARGAANFPLRSEMAGDDVRLKSYVDFHLSSRLRTHLERGHRIIVEGTQGFGLSLLEGGYWPNATSRSTTAAGALAESGLSPLDVDDVSLVIRTFPIRVAGNSGPLANEMTWEKLSKRTGGARRLGEYTSVTGKLRRVGEFDSEIVERGITANAPTRLVLNHLDYVGEESELSDPKSELCAFISNIEALLGRRMDWLGFSGKHFIERNNLPR